MVVAPTTKEMKESGLSVELSAEKGAIRKTSSRQFEGSRQTERRVEAELRERKEDEAWQKECKERADGWEKERLDHEERMKKSGWGKGVSVQAKARKEEEEEEKDNIVETRFKTCEDYGPLQPLPPHPASTTASLDVAWVSASEEEEEEKAKEEKNRKSKGRASKVKGKGKETKGLSIRAPSYAQLEKANEDLKRMLEEEKEKNEKKKKERSAWRKKKATRNAHRSGSDKTLRKSSSASDADTIKDYDDVDEEELLASPPSKFVAKPRQATPMDAE